ncbi:hypothetical protein [Belliella pelovolcani]|uniref:DoxX protein n=1 Tax=Belliella pelovolcani TaxID=529505 RepID=A0A1N7JIC5_9BACT|nr:hypothetical protein [Belliella pelovolcani]SIS49079.1 hypothetical protein SAMN05421761_10133 [Belliella pelovolcani]
MINPIFDIEQIHLRVQANRWHKYFYIFCRVTLALGFFIAGMVKIMGERFASGLSEVHPMGAYLEALHHTGYYYTFIGIAQVVAALLLLWNRTVLIGALIYLSIIVNIWILSLAVRFEGSLVSSTLMVLANCYLICWNFDRVKYLLISTKANKPKLCTPEAKKFPIYFFSGVIITIALVIVVFLWSFEIMPRNSLADCKKQFVNKENEEIGFQFCECVHRMGSPLDLCIEQFEIMSKVKSN